MWVWLPQSAQKALSQPSPGSQMRTRSSPAVTEKLPGGESAVIERVVPERRWQRRQWQWTEPTNGSATWISTAPHWQRPLIGYSGVIRPREPSRGSPLAPRPFAAV